jgi:hypothetical protein
MPQAHTKAVWCLARANQPPCVLSTRELLLLAELGHLRADDVLWRSGSNAKQPIRALLGAQRPTPKPSRPASPEPPLASGALPAFPEDAVPAETEPTAAPVSHPQGKRSTWAVAGAVAAAAIAAGLLGAGGAVVFLQWKGPEARTAIMIHTEAPSAQPARVGPVAASDPAPPQDSAAMEEVAVRKVKVLEIPPPPPGQ